MVPTTATTSTPKLRPAIPLRPWSCHRARMRCRATWPRPRRRSVTGISDVSPSAVASVGRRPQGTTAVLSWKLISRDGRASGERGGHRGQRAEPNARSRAPGVRPDRITQNTGRAQCAHATDPCNKAKEHSRGALGLLYGENGNDTGSIKKMMFDRWLLPALGFCGYNIMWRLSTTRRKAPKTPENAAYRSIWRARSNGIRPLSR
jgi:hypothetical protein